MARAQESALSEQGKKQALKEQRVYVAEQEAESVQGENSSAAKIAEYDATLKESKWMLNGVVRYSRTGPA